ncbi:NAD-dependent epimerase/dehydratase family protein [Vibrio coralliilyticus]
MSFLVTGATGFIGRHFVKNSQVERLIVRKFCSDLAHFDQYVIPDISQCPDDAGMFAGCDTVIYLAGIAHEALSTASDERIDSVNNQAVCDFTRLAAKHGIKRIVFLSSTIVHGLTASSTPISEQTPVFAASVSSKAKIECERKLLEISQSCDIEVVIIRSPLVYGEGVKGNLLSLLKLIDRTRFTPFGRTINRRHYISIENLVAVLKNAARQPHISNDIFVVSDELPLSTKELVERLAFHNNKAVTHVPIPVALFKLASALLGKSNLFEQIFGDYIIDAGKYKKLFSKS